MAAAQCAVAQLETLFEDGPEFVDVAAGGQRHIRQIDGHDALVEAAVILVLAGDVIAGVCDVADARVGEAVGRQEAAAAHAGVHVALELEHLLFADVVGHHAARRALGGKAREVVVRRIIVDVVLFKHIDELGEGGRDPHALLVFDALIALLEHLLDDDGKVALFLLVARLIEIHENGDERRLTVRGQQRDHLILDGLHTAADLFAQALFDDFGDLALRRVDTEGFDLGEHLFADLLARYVDKGGEVRQRDGLAAVLVGRDLRDDLGGDVAGGGKRMGALDERAGDDRAVLQHILKVHEVAVVHMLGIIVRVVEVNDAFLVRLDDILGQEETVRQITAHLAGHIVALGGVDDGVFVGVFLLGLFVVALDERENLVVRRVALAHERARIAVGDVALGDLERAVRHDLVLDKVLNLLHRGRAAETLTRDLHALGDALDLDGRHAGVLLRNVVGLAYCGNDLDDIEFHFRAVAFDDLHVSRLLF